MKKKLHCKKKYCLILARYVLLFKELQILVCTCMFDSYFMRILTHVSVPIGRILKQLCPSKHLCLRVSLSLSVSARLFVSQYMYSNSRTTKHIFIKLNFGEFYKKTIIFFLFSFLLYNFNCNLTRRSTLGYLQVRMIFRIPDLHKRIPVPALYMHSSYHALEVQAS